MNERALVAMNSVLPPPKQGEMITVQLRFIVIVDGVPNENNKDVEWALVALDGDAFDTKMRNHLEHSSWVISPTHGPLQQAIFFVVNAKHGRGLHAAHGRARRMVALPPPRYMAEFRAYIAALQTYAVPGREQRAASTRAFIIPAARHRLLGQGVTGHRIDLYWSPRRNI